MLQLDAHNSHARMHSEQLSEKRTFRSSARVVRTQAGVRRACEHLFRRRVFVVILGRHRRGASRGSHYLHEHWAFWIRTSRTGSLRLTSTNLAIDPKRTMVASVAAMRFDWCSRDAPGRRRAASEHPAYVSGARAQRDGCLCEFRETFIATSAMEASVASKVVVTRWMALGQ